MRPFLIRVLVIALAVGMACMTGRASPQAVRPLTIETLLDIKHPSDPMWSPDGTRVAFLWDRAGVQNVWVIDLANGRPQPPRDVTRSNAGLIQGLFWSRDSHTVFFSRDGDLWQVGADGASQPRAVWTTSDVESGIALAPDGVRVAFSRGGDLWVRSLGDDRETQLTRTPETENAPTWSPDGARLAYSVSGSVRRTRAPAFWGSKLLFAWNERTRLPGVGIVAASGGPPTAVTVAGVSAGSDSAPRWIDAMRLSLQRIEEGWKARDIIVANATDGAGRVLDREVDAKWFGVTYDNADPAPSPDGRWIAFVSDRDGWDQLYLVGAADGRLVQVTHGKNQVARVAWSPDGRRITFDSNDEGPPGRMQITAVDLRPDGSTARAVKVTSGPGPHVGAVWAPRGDQIVFEHTDGQNSADFYLTSATPGASTAPTRLTDSMPAALDRSGLVPPTLIWYPSSDGQQVPASLFVPQGLDRSRKHPAVVWIHGDLVTQNYEGWHIRRDYGVYYSFHQYLLQQGYVVLAPDYRGSIGYGKAWRQGVYRDLGGRDAQDVTAGVAYLKTLGFVDTNRVGVWGLSYGGFSTLQVLELDPTLFACGIDVAGVTDWGDYHRDPGNPWLDARMGTAQDNPKGYEQGAPVLRAEKIVRPLLLLGGTADTNVPFEQTATMLDRLLKAGKDIDLMMYPGEIHYFHRAHVIRDAWRRVERFFAQHLQPERPS